MKKIILIMMLSVTGMMFFACKPKEKTETAKEDADTFKYQVDQFADLKILRYKVDGFDSLSLNQKILIYYLSQAALCGHEIVWDQNYKYNLVIKRTLEEVYKCYKGDRNSEDFKKFVVYLKRLWFSKGIHHHYSSDKFFPEFSKEYLKTLMENSPGAQYPVFVSPENMTLADWMTMQLFDPNVAPKKVWLDPSQDLVTSSATNFYEGVTEKEADGFYKKMIDEKNPRPVSYGLNSKLVKEDGQLVEKTYKLGGMYSTAIEQIIFWLEKATTVAENPKQKAVIEKLIEYYKSGDLKTWDDYNILWVQDMDSKTDFVNGFIEDYEDPLGRKATFESVVNFKDEEATKRSELMSKNAQWFENNSPVDENYKKKEVKGVTAKVIVTAQLSGDAFPATPIGINLPNADWIRKDYGSKSVTMDNITWAYDRSSIGNGFMEEFCYSPEEIELNKKWGYLAGNLTTDLHECLGHGSGQLKEGVSSSALSNYQSTIEEARADLFALYYIMDKKMVELGLISTLDVAKAEYNNYMRNGLLTQLTRIELGKTIEESHMRNRALIAHWVYEKGKAQNVVEMKVKDGKTFVVVNDYDKLRVLFGELLKEIQRIKSEGDYNAAKNLVENYGVKVDPKLHQEVKSRYEKLHLAPYAGFINPVYSPVYKGKDIIDIKITYPTDFIEQQLLISRNYSFLPVLN